MEEGEERMDWMEGERYGKAWGWRKGWEGGRDEEEEGMGRRNGWGGRDWEEEKLGGGTDGEEEKIGRRG